TYTYKHIYIIYIYIYTHIYMYISIYVYIYNIVCIHVCMLHMTDTLMPPIESASLNLARSARWRTSPS
ncbi:MAG TPA: hypothetical protein EYP98_20130, partial [Planctomycetes bacterium]|nr:hypothetical protein [Planctomycetota bacterium]